MPRAIAFAGICTAFVLATLASGSGARSAAVVGPVCQSPGDDPTFIDHPDLNQDTPQCYRSPDGRKVAVVRGGIITVQKDGAAFEVGTTEQGRILWSPASDGFVVADSQGSGQTEIFSFVDLALSRPSMISGLRETATSRYQSAFNCDGPNWFANTITDGWTADGQLRMVVQDGVHSEGCAPRGEMIGVIGAPRTGAISRVLTAEQVRREWCTAVQRREPGYCYDYAAARGARR